MTFGSLAVSAIFTTNDPSAQPWRRGIEWQKIPDGIIFYPDGHFHYNSVMNHGSTFSVNDVAWFNYDTIVREV